MGTIYWLASYPKSGNTWMRILLTNYLRNGDSPADINSLDGGPIARARAVEFSSFQQVQRQEQEQGFGEKMPLAESFFRRGVVGSWREALSPDLVEKLITDHHAVMTRLGYLTASGELVY